MIKTSSEEALLTREEVREKFGVCYGTHWNWSKQRILVPIKIGRKVRYRFSDVSRVISERGNVSLSDIVEHYNAIYGLDMTDVEVYEGFRRIKQRKGKSGRMLDPSRNIYDLGYYTYEANRRLNQHILETGMLEGGRPSRPEAYKGNEA